MINLTLDTTTTFNDKNQDDEANNEPNYDANQSSNGNPTAFVIITVGLKGLSHNVGDCAIRTRILNGRTSRYAAFRVIGSKKLKLAGIKG